MVPIGAAVPSVVTMTESTPAPETADVDTSPEAEPGTAPDVEPDSESDPALDDSTASEWASEGGAVNEGPATDTDAG